MFNINKFLSNPHQDYITDHISYQDFAKKITYLSGVFKKKNIKQAALFFEDSLLFSSTLFALLNINAEIFLVPELTQNNLDLAKEYSNFFIKDDDIKRLLEDYVEPKEININIDENLRIFLKTSGSTGEAKIIAKTVKQLELEANELASFLDSNLAGLRVISSVSFLYQFGLSFRIFTALAMRWKFERLQQVFPENICGISQKHKSVWITSPALLQRLDANIHLDNKDLIKNVKLIITAGAPLNSQISQLIYKYFNIYPLNIYGSTEHGIIAYKYEQEQWNLFASVNAKLDERECFVFKSPWCSNNKQEIGVEVESSDCGELHKRQLLLFGRKDRIIKLEDKRISLDNVENILKKSTYLSDIYCNIHNNKIAAWLELNESGIEIFRNKGRQYLISQLKQIAKENITETAIPRYWRFSKSLPRTAQGKIKIKDFENKFSNKINIYQYIDIIDNTLEGDYLRITATIPLDCPYFSGHFADFPLVPGVIEIAWMEFLAKKYQLIPEDKYINSAEQLKFQNFIRPNDIIDITLKYEKNKLLFSIKNKNSICSSGKLIFNI